MEEIKFERSESKIDDVTWSHKMKSDLLACHAEALEDFNSDDPPRYLCSGNIVGMKQLLIRKWEEIGYRNLELTPQDLQDMVWKIKYNYVSMKFCSQIFYTVFFIIGNDKPGF